MKEKKPRYNRSMPLVYGFSMTFLAGIVYIWSVFVVPLENEFGWSRGELSVAFSMIMVMLTVGSLLGGYLLEKKGARTVLTTGSVILGLSFISVSFIESLIGLYILYGLLCGLGIGMLYVPAIAIGIKWFPERSAFAAGVIVTGVGVGTLVFAPLATWLIIQYGWRSTFQYLGIILLIGALILAQLMKTPEVNWKPPVKSKSKSVDAQKDGGFTPKEMVVTPQFWQIYAMFMLFSAPGLMVIGHIAAFAEGIGMEKMVAAAAISVLSFCNAASRMGIGAIADRIGIKKVLIITSIVQMLIMAMLIRMTTVTTLYFAAAVIGVCFGSILALPPALTANYFGIQHIGKNYGILLTAWGMGAVIGTSLGGYLFDLYGSYSLPFIVAAVFSGIAALILFTLKPPKHR